MASRYIKGFFMELSTVITRAQQQRNATTTQFDSSDFFVRRPEEDEGTYEKEEFERIILIIRTRN